MRRAAAAAGSGMRRPSASAASPIGRLTRNTSRQPPRSTISPPSTGPSAEASAATPAITPDHLHPLLGRMRRHHEQLRGEHEHRAAGRLQHARADEQRHATGAVAHSSEPAVNAARPARNSRRPPTTSASRPAGTSSAAKTIAYALRIHERPASVAPAERRAHVGERDVDDRRVEIDEERRGGPDRQHGSRPQDAARGDRRALRSGDRAHAAFRSSGHAARWPATRGAARGERSAGSGGTSPTSARRRARPARNSAVETMSAGDMGSLPVGGGEWGGGKTNGRAFSFVSQHERSCYLSSRDDRR